MIIAIDFDGTIVEHDFPEIGKLKPHAKEIINRLFEQGHKIIIWTCRSTQIHKTPNSTIFAVKDFLLTNGIRFHTINNNYAGLGFQPSPKVYADLYIDDRQLGGIPDDWRQIYDMIKIHTNGR